MKYTIEDTYFANLSEYLHLLGPNEQKEEAENYNEYINKKYKGNSQIIKVKGMNNILYALSKNQ